MDREQAKRNIKETFEASFNEEKFIYFIMNLLNLKQSDIKNTSFGVRQGYNIPEMFRSYISRFQRIAKYLKDDNRIDVLIVYLKKETSIEYARSMQRNFIAGYLKGNYGSDNLKDTALVAFVSPDKEDWRFSLVKIDYRFEEGKAGRKVKEEFTPARRWSFLVGKNEKSHTAQSQLVDMLADDKHNPTLSQLEEAFNIETVTKEFFLQYRNLFIQTKEALDKVLETNLKVKFEFEAKGVNTVDFAKKLLGQIVFLYFLQKKGWFGVGPDDNWGTGSKHFLRGLFEKKHGDYNNFFNDILEPLFYDALSRDRSDIDHWNDHFKCKIPFLNGGLFDPIGNYDWWHTDINLPNDLFSNSRQTREGDTGDGILDVFDRYNFTVREDEPLEKEVAIDPELLGKAYEKFNTIRPDNFDEFINALKSGRKGEENKFNKKFGVYYTPREIVHYMCKQSLINYLYTQANKANFSSPLQKTDLEGLIEVGELIYEHEATALIKQENIKNGVQKSSEYTLLLSDSIRENAKAIDDWLEKITVCDPAVGSGAFPVGMMNEIVRARNVLSVFLNDRERNDYEFKRRCIEHSLYGVDIDPGAVEIAKLRLWLSLVVDEEDIKNIKPLPNLDYRIMQGNSLISEFMGINFEAEKQKDNQNPLFRDETDKLIESFQQKKDEFLNESNVSKKAKLKDEIEQFLINIFKTKLKTQNTTFFNQLKDIENKYSLLPNEKERNELIKQEKEKLYKETGIDLETAEKQLKEFTAGRQIKPFFLWNLYFSDVFHQKGGFDVVIANPPYVTTKYGKISKDLKQIYIKNFKSAYDKLDLYVLFIEKAINISKNHGVTTFITPWNFLANFYSFKIRKFLLENTKIKIFNKLPPNVFGSIIVDNIISIFEKDKNNKGNQILFNDFQNKDNRKYVNQNNYFENEKYVFVLPKDEVARQILKKMKVNSVKLGEVALNYIGIMTGDQKKMIANKPIFKNSKPVLGGKDIAKWIYFDRGNYVNFDKTKIHSNDNEEVYLSEKKILLRKTGRELAACLDKKQFFSIQSLYNIVVKNERYTEEYLLSQLNSKLFSYIYNKFFITNPEVFPYIKRRHLDQLPVKKISHDQQKPFIDIVNKIITLTKNNDFLKNPSKQTQVKEYEKQIDQMIYKLYDLTDDEIVIVENIDSKK